MQREVSEKSQQPATDKKSVYFSFRRHWLLRQTTLLANPSKKRR